MEWFLPAFLPALQHKRRRFQPDEFEKISRAIAVGSRIGLEAIARLIFSNSSGWKRNARNPASVFNNT